MLAWLIAVACAQPLSLDPELVHVAFGHGAVAGVPSAKRRWHRTLHVGTALQYQRRPRAVPVLRRTDATHRQVTDPSRTSDALRWMKGHPRGPPPFQGQGEAQSVVAWRRCCEQVRQHARSACSNAVLRRPGAPCRAPTERRRRRTRNGGPQRRRLGASCTIKNRFGLPVACRRCRGMTGRLVPDAGGDEPFDRPGSRDLRGRDGPAGVGLGWGRDVGQGSVRPGVRLGGRRAAVGGGVSSGRGRVTDARSAAPLGLPRRLAR